MELFILKTLARTLPISTFPLCQNIHAGRQQVTVDWWAWDQSRRWSLESLPARVSDHGSPKPSALQTQTCWEDTAKMCWGPLPSWVTSLLYSSAVFQASAPGKRSTWVPWIAVRPSSPPSMRFSKASDGSLDSPATWFLRLSCFLPPVLLTHYEWILHFTSPKAVPFLLFTHSSGSMSPTSPLGWMTAGPGSHNSNFPASVLEKLYFRGKQAYVQ